MAGEDVNRLRAARDLAAECRAQGVSSLAAADAAEVWRSALAWEIGRNPPSERTWALVVELLSWTELTTKTGS